MLQSITPPEITPLPPVNVVNQRAEKDVIRELQSIKLPFRVVHDNGPVADRDATIRQQRPNSYAEKKRVVLKARPIKQKQNRSAMVARNNQEPLITFAPPPEIQLQSLRPTIEVRNAKHRIGENVSGRPTFIAPSHQKPLPSEEEVETALEASDLNHSTASQNQSAATVRFDPPYREPDPNILPEFASPAQPEISSPQASQELNLQPLPEYQAPQRDPLESTIVPQEIPQEIAPTFRALPPENAPQALPNLDNLSDRVVDQVVDRLPLDQVQQRVVERVVDSLDLGQLQSRLVESVVESTELDCILSAEISQRAEQLEKQNRQQTDPSTNPLAEPIYFQQIPSMRSSAPSKATTSPIVKLKAIPRLAQPFVPRQDRTTARLIYSPQLQIPAQDERRFDSSLDSFELVPEHSLNAHSLMRLPRQRSGETQRR